MALTASTPAMKGRLLDTDARWGIISESVDCRTPAERGREDPNAPYEYLNADGQRRIYKSRYDSISAFIYQGYSSAQNATSEQAGLANRVLNTYNDGGAKNWSVELQFNGTDVIDDFGAVTTPIIFDEWVPIVLDIDLDNDLHSLTYGGTPIKTNAPWSTQSGVGAPTIGALDLFSAGASPVYYDDISLVPEPATGLLLLLGLAGAALTVRRRR